MFQYIRIDNLKNSDIQKICTGFGEYKIYCEAKTVLLTKKLTVKNPTPNLEQLVCLGNSGLLHYLKCLETVKKITKNPSFFYLNKGTEYYQFITK